MNETTPSDILPFHATEVTLANELRVIVVPTGFPNLVSLQIPVQTGSRNDIDPGKSGFAHFFEHMMFRGTDRISTAEYMANLTRSGARYNAYTTDDYTNYHMTFAAEDLDRMLDYEADRFMNLRYSEEDFKTEAGAVLGEYNKNAANPLQKLIEVQRDHAFTTHPYKHTTMGFLRDIEDMPNQFEHSRTFFDRWYRPEYTTIIVAGDVEPGSAVPLVEKHWSGWKRGSYSTKIPSEPPATAPVSVHVPWDSETLPWITVGFHASAFSEGDPSFAALDMLLDLQFGRTSDLYRRLVEVEQRVDELFTYSPPTADPSLVSIMARLKQPEDAAYVRDAILAAIAAARREPPAAQRLDEAKSHARYAFARTLDNSTSIAETLASFVRFRRSYDTLNVLFRQYDALRPEELQRAAQEYFTDANLVLTTLSHDRLPAAAADTPQISSFDPTPVPKVDGIPFIIQHSELPLVRIKIQFAAGSSSDPPGKEGLATMAGEMIADAGSRNMRIDEIHRALFPIAGGFRAEVDKEVTTFTGIIHRDNAERFANIILTQLLDPAFGDDDFTRIREQQQNALVQDLRTIDEPELAKQRLQQNIFENTRYAHPSLGTVAGIESITVDDIRQFTERSYTRANAKVGLAGDVPEAFIDRVRAELGRLPSESPAATWRIEAHEPHGLELEIIEKETRSTAIAFGRPISVTRSHADYVPLWLARTWLGGQGADARLFNRIRSVRGLNYGDYAYIEATIGFTPQSNRPRRAQIMEVLLLPVMPDRAVFALKLALHEVQQMLDRGLTQEDLEETRNYLMKNVFIMTMTQELQLGYALDSRWYGIGEFTQTMRDELSKLTRERVNEVLRTHFSATDLNVVMVTADGAALRDRLLSDDVTSITYDAPKPQDILEEDRIVGARKLGIHADAIRLTPVEDVFAR